MKRTNLSTSKQTCPRIRSPIESISLIGTRVIVLIATILATTTLTQASVPAEEAWRADITYSSDADVRTQAVELDSAGNSYVAGVSVSGPGYVRFIQKLDRSGTEVWRYEADYTDAYADIVHQQVIIDEAEEALYVLRSNMRNVSNHLISVAKHGLSDGVRIWNIVGGEARVPNSMRKSAAMGIGAGGVVWVAYQNETTWPTDGLRATIHYRTLSTATGARLADGMLTGGARSDRYLNEMVANGDRLFVAYRQTGTKATDLAVTAYDISSGIPTIVNPHDPTPCSATAPCRQELNFNIPTSTEGSLAFTDGVLDADGNFAIAGYYEHIESYCARDCFEQHWYYPVVVKVDRSNNILFQTIEQGSAGVHAVGGHSSSTDSTASVTGWNDDLLLVLVAGKSGDGYSFNVVMELDANGVSTDSRSLLLYSNETFSGGVCNEWHLLWQPRALTADSDRFVVTGQLPAICRIPPTSEHNRSRTVSFSDASKEHQFFTAPFKSGFPSGPSVCSSWNDFRSRLEGEFSAVILSGSADGTGISCDDPAAATRICNALNTGATLSGVACGGNTWNVGQCGGTAVAVNSSVCSCPKSGAHIARPCISNSNWGGMGTATCNGPTQSLEVRCMRANETVFEDDFTQGVTPSSKQCSDWNNFLDVVSTNDADFVRLSGSADETGVSCNDPAAAAQICNALNTGATIRGVPCDGKTWNVGNCGGTAIGVNSDVCRCPSSGAHIARPCISNRNWGGMDTATCNGPSQSMRVSCGTKAKMFSHYFPEGSANSSHCSAWNNFRASLTGVYSKITLRGSTDPVGKSCTGTAANTICQALRSGDQVSGISCDGNVWNVGNCGGTSVSVNSSVCRCTQSSAHIVRPCINNPNWGGMGTKTCGSPRQSMDVICE